jgi:hypothetical protein
MLIELNLHQCHFDDWPYIVGFSSVGHFNQVFKDCTNEPCQKSENRMKMDGTIRILPLLTN